MANLLTGNPFVVDSTGLLFSGQGAIRAVVFVNNGGDADLTLVITDAKASGSAKEVVNLELTAERKSEVLAPPGGIAFGSGLYCETIDGGKALVYL